MNLLPMDLLGVHETPANSGILTFGFLLPGINSANGDQVSVKIVPETEQFTPTIQPVIVPLANVADPAVADYGDYWTGQIDIGSTPPPQGSRLWGRPGTYVYYVAVQAGNGAVADYLIDPFAREFGLGDLSATTLGYTPYVWSAAESGWRTPPLPDLIVYELQINEFGGSIEETVRLLDYLQGLGVNAIEVMPVHNVALKIDWGYSPFGYFGVDERFGNRGNFQAIVDAAHQRGMAVILDVVYGHTAQEFAYVSLYAQLQRANPLMNPQGTYGPTPDYTVPLMRDLFYTINHHWLEVYHLDGFRYDNVDGFWDGQAGSGYYPALTEATYKMVQDAVQPPIADPFRQRFGVVGDPELRLIQCAEYLPDPPAALNNSYTTCVWQNQTLSAAQTAASGGSLYDLGMRLGLQYYPESVTLNGDTLTKRGFQYIETHDHQRFVCNYGTHLTDVLQTDVLREGNRDNGADSLGHPYPANWFRAQPYLIGLFTGKGIPFLWQGQEFGENYYVPEDWHENGRVRLFRPVRWNLQRDSTGQALGRLTRKLIQIRRNGVQFRTGAHCFYNDYADYQSKGLLLFSRQNETTFSLIALNFTDQPQIASFAFPRSGDYREEIEGGALPGVTAGAAQPLTIPSNYGCIWTL